MDFSLRDYSLPLMPLSLPFLEIFLGSFAAGPFFVIEFVELHENFQ
jgi:hypothetical protein